MSLEGLVRVRNALTAIRGGDRRFSILYVPQSQTVKGMENIIVREAKNLGITWDRGDDERWREILNEFKFTPNIWS